VNRGVGIGPKSATVPVYAAESKFLFSLVMLNVLTRNLMLSCTCCNSRSACLPVAGLDCLWNRRRNRWKFSFLASARSKRNVRTKLAINARLRRTSCILCHGSSILQSRVASVANVKATLSRSIRLVVPNPSHQITSSS
jgi:hypothetical protein